MMNGKSETPKQKGITWSWWLSSGFVFLVVVAGIWLVAAPKTSAPPVVTVRTPADVRAPGGTCPSRAAEPLTAGMSLTAAPRDTEWTSTKIAALPGVSGQGPFVVDAGDRYRHCFAKSLVGAALAAASYEGQFADPALWEKAVRKGTVPQADTEEQIRILKQRGGPNADGAQVSILGLTSVRATSASTVVVGLVVLVNGSPVSFDFTMLWNGDDWLVRPAIEPGDSLDDYWVWTAPR